MVLQMWLNHIYAHAEWMTYMLLCCRLQNYALNSLWGHWDINSTIPCLYEQCTQNIFCVSQQRGITTIEIYLAWSHMLSAYPVLSVSKLCLKWQRRRSCRDTNNTVSLFCENVLARFKSTMETQLPNTLINQNYAASIHLLNVYPKCVAMFKALP